MPHDGLQGSKVLQVKSIACVAFRDQQNAACIGADFLHRRHHCLHAQWHELWIKIIETSGEQIRIDGRQFEAAVAQIHRAVKRNGMRLPLIAQPVLDAGHGIDDTSLQIKDRPAQGSSKMGYRHKIRMRFKGAASL